MILALTCAALVSGCGERPDLTGCVGWTGGPPKSEQEFALAASAEKRGRELCNVKLEAARKYYQRRG